MNSNFENMMHEYRSAFVALGFDVQGKDIVEVLTFLVNELNNTKAELYQFKTETETKIWDLTWR